ncbi:hypothetical protein CR513_14837, partial [Mucuna pruriens]
MKKSNLLSHIRITNFNRLRILVNHNTQEHQFCELLSLLLILGRNFGDVLTVRVPMMKMLVAISSNGFQIKLLMKKMRKNNNLETSLNSTKKVLKLFIIIGFVLFMMNTCVMSLDAKYGRVCLYIPPLNTSRSFGQCDTKKVKFWMACGSTSHDNRHSSCSVPPRLIKEHERQYPLEHAVKTNASVPPGAKVVQTYIHLDSKPPTNYETLFSTSKLNNFHQCPSPILVVDLTPKTIPLLLYAPKVRKFIQVFTSLSTAIRHEKRQS